MTSIMMEPLAPLLCSKLMTIAMLVVTNQTPTIDSDPNVELVEGRLPLAEYYAFAPSQQHKELYNQTLYVLQGERKHAFETAIGKTCRGAFVLKTDSLYDRNYADAHHDIIDMFVLDGAMEFFKHLCPSQPNEYFQLRDSKIWSRDACAVDAMVTLTPCSLFRHDARGPHSVKIKHLPMLRLLCLNSL